MGQKAGGRQGRAPLLPEEQCNPEAVSFHPEQTADRTQDDRHRLTPVQ